MGKNLSQPKQKDFYYTLEIYIKTSVGISKELQKEVIPLFNIFSIRFDNLISLIILLITLTKKMLFIVIKIKILQVFNVCYKEK